MTEFEKLMEQVKGKLTPEIMKSIEPELKQLVEQGQSEVAKSMVKELEKSEAKMLEKIKTESAKSALLANKDENKEKANFFKCFVIAKTLSSMAKQGQGADFAQHFEKAYNEADKKLSDNGADFKSLVPSTKTFSDMLTKADFQNENIASEGKEWVFQEFVRDIEYQLDRFPLIQRLRTFRTGVQILNIPTAVNAITAGWTGEGENATLSKATSGTIAVTVQKVTSFVTLTEELFQDSATAPAVYDLLVEFMANAMGMFWEDQLINGDGQGTGQKINVTGLLADTDIPDITLTGNSVDDLTSKELVEMAYEVDDKYLMGLHGTDGVQDMGVYIFHKTVVGKIANLTDGNGAFIYPQLQNNPRDKRINGYEVLTTTVMKKASAVGANERFGIFGNLSHVARVVNQESTMTQGFASGDFQADKFSLKLRSRGNIKNLQPKAFVAIKTSA